MNDSAYLVSWVGIDELRLMTHEHVEDGWIPDGKPIPIDGGGLQQKLHRASAHSAEPKS